MWAEAAVQVLLHGLTVGTTASQSSHTDVWSSILLHLSHFFFLIFYNKKADTLSAPFFDFAENVTAQNLQNFRKGRFAIYGLPAAFVWGRLDLKGHKKSEPIRPKQKMQKWKKQNRSKKEFLKISEKFGSCSSEKTLRRQPRNHGKITRTKITEILGHFGGRGSKKYGAERPQKFRVRQKISRSALRIFSINKNTNEKNISDAQKLGQNISENTRNFLCRNAKFYCAKMEKFGKFRECRFYLFLV